LKEITVSKDLKRRFQIEISKWAKKNLIDYPWRENRNPYKVLICEILLIRTKAPQVDPVFRKFMRKYPDMERFLKAKLKDLEKLIRPLGLLFRAKMLRELANQLESEFNRQIPDNFNDLKALKGIGDYAANAILCFGFDKKRPLLDSNFIRIYERFFNITSKTKTPKTDKYLWNISDNLLPDEGYVQFNYAILDFGGNVCLSKNPKCSDCPLNNHCYYLTNL